MNIKNKLIGVFMIFMILFMSVSMSVSLAHEGHHESKHDNPVGVAVLEADEQIAQAPRETTETRTRVSETKEVVRKHIEEYVALRERITKKIEDVKDAITQKRQQIKDAQDELKRCKGDTTSRCSEARKEAKAHAKHFLSNSADAILAVLERMRERVSNQVEDEAKRDGLLADIDAKINEITAAKLKIESLGDDATPEQLREAARTINAAWKRMHIDVKKKAADVAGTQMFDITQKLDKLHDKLEKRVEQLKQNGVDTSSVALLITKLEQTTAQAKAILEEAKNMFENAATEEQLKAAREKLKESHNLIKEARNIVKQVVAQLKEQLVKETEQEAEN